MEMVNGYVFLDLTKANVYAKALKVLGADKPVVIKEGSGSPYFVDSLTLDGTNVVITKGGKTITIANDNTITNVGDIQNHLYIYQLDLSGATLDSDISLPNGNYSIAICSTIKLDTSNPLPTGHYTAYNSCYESNGSTNNIFEIQFSENSLDVSSDGRDENLTIATSYNGSIYNRHQLF